MRGLIGFWVSLALAVSTTLLWLAMGVRDVYWYAFSRTTHEGAMYRVYLLPFEVIRLAVCYLPAIVILVVLAGAAAHQRRQQRTGAGLNRTWTLGWPACFMVITLIAGGAVVATNAWHRFVVEQSPKETEFARIRREYRKLGFEVKLDWNSKQFVEAKLLGPLRPGSLSKLSQEPHLRSLYLNHPSVDDKALPDLAMFPTLSELDLSGSSVTDDGMQSIATLPVLHSLTIDNTKVGDPGLASLARVRFLLQINANHTQVTASGAETLRRLRPHVAYEGSGR